MNKNTQTQPHNPLEGDRPEIVLNLQDGTEEQISIIVVHRDKPELLNICLQSIAIMSFNNNIEIIVVDNGSGKESQDYLDDLSEEIKVIRLEHNKGWSAAANKGAAVASKTSKYLVFMHCDVVVLNQSWLDLLTNVSESQAAGMVGVELANYFMQQQRVDFIQEWCVLFTRECWQSVGPWAEELPQIGMSFILTMKAQKQGWKPQVMRNPICHHYRVFSLNINEYERLQEQAMVTLPRLLQQVQSDEVK